MIWALRDPAIRRLAVIQTLLEVQFWFPLWLIFLLDRGFDLTTAVLADALFRLVSVASEVPVGRWADRFGRKGSLVCLGLGNAAVFCLISYVHENWQLMAVWAMWGVVWALATGAVTSYLFEICEQRDVPARRAFAVVRACAACGVLLSLGAAGFLYAAAPEAPFWMTAALSLIATVVCIGLPSLPRAEPPSLQSARGLRSALRSRPSLRRVAVVMSLHIMLGWSATILYQPMAQQREMSAVSTGLMFTVFATSGMLGSLVSGVVPPARRAACVIACTWLLGAALLLCTVPADVAVWVSLGVLGFVYSCGLAILEVALHEQTPGYARATAFGFVSMGAGALMIVFRPTLGQLADVFGVGVALSTWASVALLAAGLLTTARLRH